jgi:2-amino-4-hydroxy-6-hydroxymethyldihydropteridine diphosphokinase
MTQAIIGLGSNLGDRGENLRCATLEIERRVGRLLRSSTVRETPALVLPEDDASAAPPYYNSAILVETGLTPEKIMSLLLEIEAELGRDRRVETRRWQPRLIDLDLLAVEQLTSDLPTLTLPHPQLQHRLFVLEPLAEICPDWEHPRLKRSAVQLLQDLRQ